MEIRISELAETRIYRYSYRFYTLQSPNTGTKQPTFAGAVLQSRDTYRLRATRHATQRSPPQHAPGLVCSSSPNRRDHLLKPGLGVSKATEQRMAIRASYSAQTDACCKHVAGQEHNMQCKVA